jgi:hypothetical protein
MKKNKEKIVTVLFDEDEYRQLTKHVAGLNITYSDYLRQSAFYVNIKSKADTENTGLLISSLNKIGNNINQIAYVLNFAHKKNILEMENFENILDELTVIRATLGSFDVR